ncbi:mitochondrial intermembrane space import and assembly protein 40-B [Uranotaenia lowii]|uniref:mitochondrial intermembrane space import and assembly protein 40-B n=1 Tax=Uranotaenia lowii TaxID=190385 RepID=UPI0024797E54|nr:mitochondrial intermembrane space import and assembly protein 40-B [Uranotaenia lowii]
MSICKSFGKDKVIFATKEDHAVPSTVKLPESEPAPGLILENGEINWGCPCLGGMATGPCGVEFRDAFSCFHYSEAQPKGSDCYDAFRTMQDCMSNYPGVYKQNQHDDDDDDEDGGAAGGLGLALEAADDESSAAGPSRNPSEAADSNGSSTELAQKGA